MRLTAELGHKQTHGMAAIKSATLAGSSTSTCISIASWQQHNNHLPAIFAGCI
jgi:hypothetical protein